MMILYTIILFYAVKPHRRSAEEKHTFRPTVSVILCGCVFMCVCVCMCDVCLPAVRQPHT